jgi:hypothetical protein
VAPRGPSPPAALSPALAAELTAVWPVLQALASWWQERHHLAQEDDTPDRKLVRQTYHIEQRYIEAVRRESDRTGESYAAVVNRAFARYFAGRQPWVYLVESVLASTAYPTPVLLRYGCATVTQ